MRITVLFDNFGPYHYARLNAAASVMEAIGIETFARSREYEWLTNLEAKFQRITLFPASADSARDASGLSDRLAEELRKAQPDAVAIPGWSSRAAFSALNWCASTGTPAILMSESTTDDEPRVAWRESIKRRIVSLYSTALVGGQRHVDYLTDLGMPRERIFTGYDAVENAHFARGAEEARGGKVQTWEGGKAEEVRGGKEAEVSSQRSEDGGWEGRKDERSEGRKAKVENEFALPQNYFLASARFVEKKNLPALIRAYARYREAAEVRGQKSEVREQSEDGNPIQHPTSDIRHPTSDLWHLVLLGDGPLRADLCRLISDLGLQDFVHLPGFKQYDELPVYYGLAKAFVHASTTEQWGLVVNEAMASSLPVIVSNRCGCVPELVRENVNGFTFDPLNQGQITACLLAMSAMSETERAAFGQASREIAAGHDVDQFALGLKDAAELAISLPRQHASFVDRALLFALMKYQR